MLEDLGLWEHASSQIGVILMSFESSGGKQQLNVRDGMLAVLTKKLLFTVMGKF